MSSGSIHTAEEKSQGPKQIFLDNFNSQLIQLSDVERRSIQKYSMVDC